MERTKAGPRTSKRKILAILMICFVFFWIVEVFAQMREEEQRFRECNINSDGKNYGRTYKLAPNLVELEVSFKKEALLVYEKFSKLRTEMEEAIQSRDKEKLISIIDKLDFHAKNFAKDLPHMEGYQQATKERLNYDYIDFVHRDLRKEYLELKKAYEKKGIPFWEKELIPAIKQKSSEAIEFCKEINLLLTIASISRTD